MVNSIEDILNRIDKVNLTPEQIVEHIGEMYKLAREGMYIIALSNGNKELVDQIDKENELIKLKSDEFKKSVANDNYEEFLANIP